jgi:hypothetical protein
MKGVKRLEVTAATTQAALESARGSGAGSGRHLLTSPSSRLSSTNPLLLSSPHARAPGASSSSAAAAAGGSGSPRRLSSAALSSPLHSPRTPGSARASLKAQRMQRTGWSASHPLCIFYVAHDVVFCGVWCGVV